MESFCIHTRRLVRTRTAFPPRPAYWLLSSTRLHSHPRLPHHLPLQQSQVRFSSYHYRRFDNRSGYGPQRQSRPQYIWQNYRGYLIGIGVVGGLVYVSNLEKVPISGRWRFNVVSAELEREFSKDSYKAILETFGDRLLPADHPYTRLTALVTDRLLSSPDMAKYRQEKWVVHVIDAPDQKNAFVLPGGKVFVFTGILPIARDEAGLAAVLGHEIAHVVAQHGAENMSRHGILALLAIATSLLLDVSGNLTTFLGRLFLDLPNSRAQEMEADQIGQLIMAESCYPPSAAIDIWTRMQASDHDQNDVAPPQFLSTHPGHANRREHLRAWLPQAEAKYEAAGCDMPREHLAAFRHAVGAQYRRGSLL